MHFRSLPRAMCLVLILAGLPAFAQTASLSQNPRELGAAVLRELSIRDGKLSFRVDSNGCTDASSFKVRADRREGLTPKTAHYQLTLERVRRDDCTALLLEGERIELDLEKDLGLKGKYTLSVSNPVLADLLAATGRAIGLELEATRRKLEAAEKDHPETAERFRQNLRDLEEERRKCARLQPEKYPAPVLQSPDASSILESSSGSGALLPPVIREVVVPADGTYGEGDLLQVEGTSKSGPFYHLAGIAGGDYGLLKAGKRQRLALCLVYRREYFGLIGNYYVYVLSAR